MKPLLETEAGMGTRDMNENDIEDEGERAAFLTLSEEGRTSVRNVVNKMALLYSIYDVYFRTW